MANCTKFWFKICALCILRENRRAMAVGAPLKRKVACGKGATARLFAMKTINYEVVKGGSRTHFDTIQLLALILFECRPSWRTLESFHRVSKKPSLTLITYILYHTLWGLSIVFLNFFYFFYGGRIIHPRPHFAFSYER